MAAMTRENMIYRVIFAKYQPNNKKITTKTRR
jgi:hypothetical protein